MSHKPQDAWLRGGAGPMRARRAERGGTRNDSRDLLEQALDEVEDSTYTVTDNDEVEKCDDITSE